MRLMFLFMAFMISKMTSGQDLHTIHTLAAAKAFIKTHPALSGEIIQINSFTDSSLIAKKILAAKPQAPITIEGYTYKVIECKTSLKERASYIFLDGVKLNLQQIDSTRTIIVRRYRAGEDFNALAKTYTMDGNPNADLGWYGEEMMVSEFWKEVKAHKKGDIFPLDLPSKKWHYLILKTFDDRAVKTCSVLKIKNNLSGGNVKSLMNASGNNLVSEKQKTMLAEDAEFVLTKDTFSVEGPKSITRNILQDRKGNIWLATWQGIIRYDGKIFTNHTLKEGLKQFHVFSLLEDKKGNIWFGFINGGVYKYDGKSFAYFTTKDGLAGNSIMCMTEDQAGNIWMGTTNGISRYNGKSFTNYTTENGLSSNAVFSITQDVAGNMWIGTAFGVNLYDGESFVNFKNKNNFPISGVRTILEDKAGHIWIGGQDGLGKYDGKSLTNMTSNFTTNVIQDKKGNIWSSQTETSSNKMKLCKLDGNAFATIATEVQVFGIMADDAGNIWYGTESGIRRYDGKTISSFTKNQ